MASVNNPNPDFNADTDKIEATAIRIWGRKCPYCLQRSKGEKCPNCNIEFDL